ncbi:MAG TPA: 2-hydroxyacid dehydrogenase [bacterium]|nr:2-hydroxyacid dehydrogenase [bacterium]
MGSTAPPPGVRVVFAGAFSSAFADRVRAILTIACEIAVIDESTIVSRMPDVDILVTLVFTREMGAAAGRLRLVQVPGAGLDRIDRSVLPRGAWLANAYGHETAIAEYVIGAMLSWSRGFCRLDENLRRGNWDGSGMVSAPPRADLSGKVLGILGYGRIGRCVAQRAQTFGMAVHAVRQTAGRQDAAGLAFLGGPDALDAILTRADYLVIALPLTASTRGLLGARELESMKRTAVLVNVARAEIVDEEALYRALARRMIAGAVLDVWYRYPSGPAPTLPAHYAFHELPNVLMTPHVAGWTEGTLEARAQLIAGNIMRVARGEAPANVVAGPEQGR